MGTKAADSGYRSGRSVPDRTGQHTFELPRAIRDRSAWRRSLRSAISLHWKTTLALFDCGVDDVVRKPVHPREILARAAAIRRRLKSLVNFTDIGPIRVFSDGRDPEVQGEVFALPRRERRILEYLVSNRGRRVSKSQIFNAIYGIFDEDVEENVVESHISKLRKKLRKRLGFDPIDSKRFLGYCIDWS
jgi:DNA-binding response OmpR family regulator